MTKAEIDAIVSDVFRPKKITKAEVYAIVEDVFRPSAPCQWKIYRKGYKKAVFIAYTVRG